MDASADSEGMILIEEAVSDKRRYDRNDHLEELSVVWHLGDREFTSRIHDLSLGGAFIEAAEPPPSGTALKLLFRVSGKVARARAVVSRSVPSAGMAVEFVAMGQEDRACLAVAADSARELVPVTEKQQPLLALSSAINTIQTPEEEGCQKDQAPSVKERRVRVRHKVPAHVQITELATGRPISARLGTLSAAGCFLDLDTDSSFPLGTAVMVTITRGSESFQSEAKVVYALAGKGTGVTFTGTELQHLRILGRWIMETSWLAADRRMSQRIFLNVPVRVTGISALGKSFAEEAQTAKVSVDGCLLSLSTPVNKGQNVTLLNTRTNAMVECVIVRIEQSSNTQLEIGMSFLLPNQKFWQVNFPPIDRLAGPKSER
jgi:hypothetical protein